MTKYVITVVVDEEWLAEIRGVPDGIMSVDAAKVGTILVNGVRSFYEDPTRGGHWQCLVREIQS